MDLKLNWGPHIPGTDSFGRPLRFNVINAETTEEVGCYAERADAEFGATSWTEKTGTVHVVTDYDNPDA